MKLTLVPPSEFQMGSPDSDKDALAPERPQHRVRITRAIYLGKFEVTLREFRKFVEDTDYKTEAERDGTGGGGFTRAGNAPFDEKPEFTWRHVGFEQTDRHPVANVSWNDALQFCKWLSKNEGRTYRLPTEAEWEYACRAGTTSRWHCGNDEADLERCANIADASLKRKSWRAHWVKAWDDGHPFTAPVGSFKGNAFGLHDCHGNLWEWCADAYDPKYYASSPVDDPRGPDGKQKDRVVRGSSWHYAPRVCRSAYREGVPSSYRRSTLGFRVVTIPANK